MEKEELLGHTQMFSEVESSIELLATVYLLIVSMDKNTATSSNEGAKQPIITMSFCQCHGYVHSKHVS